MLPSKPQTQGYTITSLHSYSVGGRVLEWKQKLLGFNDKDLRISKIVGFITMQICSKCTVEFSTQFSATNDTSSFSLSEKTKLLATSRNDSGNTSDRDTWLTFPPSSWRTIFSGFKSLCIILFSCKYWIPDPERQRFDLAKDRLTLIKATSDQNIPDLGVDNNTL